jgi:hypothetical protein
MELVFIAIALVAFAVVSYYFGADSRNIEEALNDYSTPHASL